MANEELLANAKLLLGISSGDDAQDELILLLISRAEQSLLDYCNLTVLDQVGHVNLQLDLVAIEWNRRGMEGEQSHGEGGMSRSLIVGLPPDLTAKLNLYRKPRW